MHIRTRNGLIKWLEENAPRRAIARAMQEGQVEVCGGFKQIPPSLSPGWIVKIISKFNKTWYVIIQKIRTANPDTYRIWMRGGIPWKFWIGDQSNNKLYQGDKPLEYKRLRDEKKK